MAEPGVFVVDDVAFIHPEHGEALAREVEKRGIKKQYYLETRGDVLLRNKEIFRFWKRLGLKYMFLGIEAIDDEGLKAHRKRITIKKNIEALECARSLNIHAAVNIIADPSWDERHFQAVRDWALQVPEIVHITVNTPYPGIETWVAESRNFTTRDYRLFRRAARGAAHEVAARPLLSGAGQDAADPESKAPGICGAEGHLRHGREVSRRGADKFRQDALEIFERL